MNTLQKIIHLQIEQEIAIHKKLNVNNTIVAKNNYFLSS